MYARLLALFLCVLLHVSCAHKDAPMPEDIEAQGDKYNALSRSRAFDLQKEPYLGARLIPLDDNESALDMHVILRKRGSLASLGTALRDISNIGVHIAADDTEVHMTEPAQGTRTPSSLDLPPLSLPAENGPTKTLSVNYEGPLRGLLEQLAVQSGYGWDYDARNNSVVFAKMMVRTYTILATPGKLSYDSQITNKSKESENDSIGGTSTAISQSVSTADTSIQTSQTNKTEVRLDVWAEVENGIKNLLSKQGTVSGNPSSGTITVKDRPQNIRRISAFVRETNMRVSRQVALKVQVWSLELADDNEAGIDLQVLFQNDDISVVAGSIAALGGLNSASATIISGELKESTAVLNALKQYGHATQITSGGGLVMSNYPFPVLGTVRTGYLAGISSSVTDYGQTTEITPGEVTTGFSMSVIPHILDRRRCILQYNINLSSLDDLKEFSTDEVTVQLPQVSTRAFSQRTMMHMGQTLVLAGFQQETQSQDKSFGLFNIGGSAAYGKSLLIITIELESAGNGMES